GKSNIADSLRWVLGEQSYALLRGRKTEDMIFSGSEQRPRAGMAAATITFDNADGWLPIDFSEVSITRRAYRDGQNEYLLNGQKVRLREISELLAQSGLAERTYTVLGQGVVDAALALKPEERRKLFEEAAGIGLYRSRREEGLNRLENTKRNLERIQDILVELGPRLQSLEKQAKRAQEYERIRADLRVLLRDWYGFHWHNQQQEVRRAVEVLKVQDSRLEQAREKVQTVEGQITDLRGRMNVIRTRLGELHAEFARLHQEREKITRNLAILDERQRSFSDQRSGIQNDLARLEEEINANQERLKNARDEKERYQDELKDAQQQVEMARKALDDRQRERINAERALRTARQQLTAAETRLVQVKAHLNELESRRANEKRSLDNLAQSDAKSAEDLDKARLRLQNIENEKKAIESAREEAQKALQTSRRQIDELDSKRKAISDQRAQKEAERSRIQAQLDVLENAERSHSGLGGGAKALLQAAKQGRIKGNYQLISRYLDVPKEYEVAIAAALGEYLDLVVVDGSDPEQALNLLASSDQGRAALLPVNWLREADKVKAPVRPDCFGTAADLAHVSNGSGPVIDVLLGQMLVVRDRAAARAILKDIPEAACAVTLLGEIFYANGAVIAGRNGQAAPAALSRPRQIRELTAAVEAASQAVKGVQEQIQRIDQEQGKLKEHSAEADRTLRQLTAQADKVFDQYKQATLQVEQAQRQQEWQTRQKQNIEGQIARTQQEIEQNNARIDAVSKEISTARDEVHQCSAALASLPLEELQMQVNHWNTTTAVASRTEQEASRRVNEIEQTAARNAQQLAGMQRRFTEVTSGLSTLEQQKVDAHTQEQTANQQIDALQTVLTPAENELQQIEKEYSELQEIDTAAQQAQTVAERYHAQAQMDLTRQREVLDNLRKKIEDDFGLVMFEYTQDVSGQTPLPLDGMVEQLPAVVKLPEGLEDNISRMRGHLRRIGAINPDALTEYTSVAERHKFLTGQVEDLKKADADLRQVIAELDELMRREFKKTFDAVSVEFKSMFTRLFGGGSAKLILSDADNPTETGIDIEARLPGRRDQGLSLLSGGERSLTAVSLIFALLKVSPTPFCVMDEVDAMLDEANVGRFRDLLAELSSCTQFIVITHNRNTVQAANVIYGVTMGRDSASRVMSLRLEEVPEDMAK
ncbi:MAG TPA: chromosome segregation protein SMC, partial [Anaerolineaceae bacterium]|nr:chromosome segregation protein SMC [Anaerolineaceae bacterium]